MEIERANDCLRSRRIQIGVRNFGPIARGLVDLRPLTVFVGPSNTGKTYLSILAYAVHRSLGGFQRLPLSHQSVNFPGDLIGTDRDRTSEDPGPWKRSIGYAPICCA